ncbi:MAG TPA: SDR family oxidoreductase [Polyangiaceae bacterium]|nr:SDR family oxidoreductase [Polyangiaceae bacterium]
MGSYLVTGVANEWSIAWAIAEQLLAEGSECFVVCHPNHHGRVRRLMARYNAERNLFDLEVASDESLQTLAAVIASRTDTLLGLLHSIAFADGAELQSGILATSRHGFGVAMDRSVFSFLALVRDLAPRLGTQSSVVTLSYYGAQKCMPGYGVMGVAKAALESLVRYLAAELGPRGVRVNAVSAGPIATLSSSVFPDIHDQVERAAAAAPLRRATSQSDVADVVRFLFSPASAAISGQCVFADHGLSSLGGG